MSRAPDRDIARMFSELHRDESEIDVDLVRSASLAGGEPRNGQLTGTKALMLAVLEDGIRSYLSGSRSVAQEAEFWVHSEKRRSPFSFIVVCEMLGLDTGAVRLALKRLRERRVPARKALPRARPNVRVSGRVCARGSD